MTNRGVTSPTHPRRLTNTEKLERALQLRRGGATFQQIAEAGLYSSRQSAQKAIMTYYERVHRQVMEHVEALRQEDIDRIEGMLRGLWTIAISPQHERHLYAVDRVVKLMQHRARLLGLEMPERHELTGQGGERLLPEGVNLSSLSPEQLEQVRAILEAAADGGHEPSPE